MSQAELLCWVILTCQADTPAIPEETSILHRVIWKQVTSLISFHKRSCSWLCGIHPPQTKRGEKCKEGCSFQAVDLISLLLCWTKAARAGKNTGKAFYQAGGNYLLEYRRKCCQARRRHFSCCPPYFVLSPLPCLDCQSPFMSLRRNGKSDVLCCWRELWNDCPSVIIDVFVHASVKIKLIGFPSSFGTSWLQTERANLSWVVWELTSENKQCVHLVWMLVSSLQKLSTLEW